eukprot:1647964-Pleurochrysis_carterae.AAC.1
MLRGGAAWRRAQVDQERHPSLAAAEDLANVAHVEKVIVRFVLLSWTVLQKLQRLDVLLRIARQPVEEGKRRACARLRKAGPK